MSIADEIGVLNETMDTFKTEYEKYAEKGVNSAGSKARKALMSAKKQINALRKNILADQKEKKAAKKAKKAE